MNTHTLELVKNEEELKILAAKILTEFIGDDVEDYEENLYLIDLDVTRDTFNDFLEGAISYKGTYRDTLQGKPVLEIEKAQFRKYQMRENYLIIDMGDYRIVLQGCH